MSIGEHSSYSEQLAEFAVNLKFSDIPAKVVNKMKLHFLDAIGIALAGTRADSPRQILLLSENLGGPPESSIIGSLKKVAAPNDAMDVGKEGTIIVKKKDGSTLEHRSKGLRGTPQRPAEPEDVHQKFLSNATHSISKDDAEKILRMLQRLDELDNVADLIKTLRVEAGQH